MTKQKDQAAVALGRKRALSMSPEQRRELGRRGAEVRWNKEFAKEEKAMQRAAARKDREFERAMARKGGKR